MLSVAKTMPALRHSSSASIDFAAMLWLTTGKLVKNMDAREYKRVSSTLATLRNTLHPNLFSGKMRTSHFL